MEFSGLATGIDTQAIVKQLIASMQNRLYTHKVHKMKWEERDTALSEIEAKVSALRASIASLTNSDDLRAFKTTSSDESVLTASAASTGVFEGSHSIAVKQLATTESWAHTGYRFRDSLVGSGNFIYSYNHEEVVLSTTADTTLEDIAGLINNDPSNPGVTATVLEYDAGGDNVFHLVLSGNDAGSDYQISVNSSTTQVLTHDDVTMATRSGAAESTLITDLNEFSGTLTGGSTEKIVINGDKDGVPIGPVDFFIEATTTVQDLIDAIETAYGEDVNVQYSGGLIAITGENGVVTENFALSFDAGAGAGDLYIGTNAKFTAPDDDAALTTKIVDLANFVGSLSENGGEKITISGTDAAGDPITSIDLTITDDTTLGHLMDRINDAYEGIAKAKLEDGKIILVDDVSGASLTTMTFTFDDAGEGTASMNNMPTFSNTAADASEGGQLSGTNSLLLGDGSFTRTQAAQDSRVKIDGYPPAISEVQTLNSTTAPTSGTYTLTFDGQTTANIAYNADAATIQAALEALSNVDAGDVIVSGTGLNDNAAATTFTFLESLGDVGAITIDPASTDQTSQSNYTVTEDTKGQDGWINRSSNTLENVLPGVTMNLYNATDTSDPDNLETIQVSLNKDVEGLKKKLVIMVGAYNNLVEVIKTNTSYDAETGEAGELISDSTTRTIRSILRSPLATTVTGFVEDVHEYFMPQEIGLEFDREGMLSLDLGVLDEKINEDYDSVLALIGADRTGVVRDDANELFSFYDSGNGTQAGAYDLKIETDDNGWVTKAYVKLSTETDFSWREVDIINNSTGVMTAASTIGSTDNDAPEKHLQFKIDMASLAANQTYTASMDIQQGFAGALSDTIDNILDSEKGYMTIGRNNAQDAIENFEEKIVREQNRLKREEVRLTAKFARLEKQLSLIQQQMGALSMMSQM